jgi:hypothetical protein
VVLSELSDKIGCCPAVDFHSPALGFFPVFLVHSRIAVRAGSPLMAWRVAKDNPHSERFALVSIGHTAERLVPVKLSGPLSAGVAE